MNVHFFVFTFFMFFSCGLNSDTPINQMNSDELLDFIDDKVIKKKVKDKDRELYSEPRGPLYIEKRIKCEI